MYDQDVEGEEAAARRCHDEMLEELVAAGYAPVRLGVQSMDMGAPSEATYIDVVERLKRLFDPNDILAPGRYDFRKHWAASGRDESTAPQAQELGRDGDAGPLQS
jgi:4-cresol dehydrogenase (hydroxylating)